MDKPGGGPIGPTLMYTSDEGFGVDALPVEGGGDGEGEGQPTIVGRDRGGRFKDFKGVAVVAAVAEYCSGFFGREAIENWHCPLLATGFDKTAAGLRQCLLVGGHFGETLEFWLRFLLTATGEEKGAEMQAEDGVVRAGLRHGLEPFDFAGAADRFRERGERDHARFAARIAVPRGAERLGLIEPLAGFRLAALFDEDTAEVVAGLPIGGGEGGGFAEGAFGVGGPIEGLQDQAVLIESAHVAGLLG